jgi:hypothetical protein
MFNKKNQATATAPQQPKFTKEELTKKLEEQKKQLAEENEEIVYKTTSLEDELKKASKKLYGTEKFSLKKNLWLSLLPILTFIGLTIGEYRMTFMGIETWGNNVMWTTILTIIIGMAIAVSANRNGYFLRRWHTTRSGLELFFSLLLLVMGCGVIWALANMRVEFIQKMEEREISLWSQAWVGLLLYLLGVISSFMTTSSAKNLKEEEIFNEELDELRNLKAEARNIQTRLQKAKRDHLDEFNAIEKYNSWKVAEDARLEKEAEDLKNRQQLEQKKQNEEKDNQEMQKNQATEQEFKRLQNDFNVNLEEMRKAYNMVGNKSELGLHTPYVTEKSKTRIILEKIEKLASEVDGGKKIAADMRNEFNQLAA